MQSATLQKSPYCCCSPTAVFCSLPPTPPPTHREKDPKRVYYLSMEFLMGRSLLNTLYNLDIKEPYDEAIRELGYNLENIAEQERDAALVSTLQRVGHAS